MLNARIVAVNVLTEISEAASYSNIAADAAINAAQLQKNEARLATAIIYGCLQRKITLDRIIKALNDKRPKKLDAFVLSALEIGVYQILFLDRIPDSAAVNESVNIIKKSRFKHSSGFVNAILRKASSNKHDLLRQIDESRDISFKYSCPVPLLKSLIADYGRETAEAYLAASLNAPETFARVNTLKISSDELYSLLEEKGIECTPWALEGCFSLKNAGSVEKLDEFKNGLFYIQDPASQLCIKALDIKIGMSVLDICSAPGGKSFTAAMYLKSSGRIVSCDLYEKRVGLISSGAERLGISNLTALVADASAVNSSFPLFDRVICDVPCSGFGVLRRKPEIKYKTESFGELEELQLKILQNASSYLKKDGKLLYSTCTLRKSENEGIVNKFLKSNPDFSIKCSRTLMPNTDGTDGFFYCVLKRK